jgi:hypothetical protein
VPVHVIDDMGRHDRWPDNREEPRGHRLVRSQVRAMMSTRRSTTH